MDIYSEKRVQLGTFVLVAIAIISDYAIMLVTDIIRALDYHSFRIELAAQKEFVLPAITSRAADDGWAFAFATALISLAAILRLRHSPDHIVRILTLGFCLQGLVVWAAMFCFCYFGFLGAPTLNQEPSFSYAAFFRFGSGAFPATLLALLVPLITAQFFYGDKRRWR
jgi:hypothetical protein